MDSEATWILGGIVALLAITGLLFVVLKANEGDTVPTATTAAPTPAPPVPAAANQHGLRFFILVLLATVAAIAVDRYLLPPRPVEYRIVALEDATSVSTLQSLGNDGWRIVSARRAINDDHGIYELIIMRE